ncbi:MAG: tetratricopeptide repeat protein, partial [Proteobacteria bacterium]|nr:tetratricopeptide repeat protein [Pseudomonadota bacterium]
GDNSWIGRGYALRKSVLLEPNNDDLAQHHADILERAGKIDEAMEYYARALRLNPYNARVLIRYSLLLVSAGDYDRALYLDKRGRELQGYPAFRVRFGVALLRNQWQVARDILDQASHPMPQVMKDVLRTVVNALETPELRYIAMERMRELSSLEIPGKLNFIYLYGGLLEANDLVFESLAAAAPDVNFWFTLFWQPETTALLSDPRLHQYFEDVGLMEYWQVFGPPDACILEPTFSCGVKTES